MSAVSTPDSLVASYRKRALASPPGIAIELEARFSNVEYDVWAQVQAAFVEGKIASERAELSQTVNVIMPDNPEMWKSRQRAIAKRRPNLVRQIAFGGPDGPEEFYYRKTQIDHSPERVPHALNYNLVLSAEEDLGKKAFTSDSDALIRFKVRSSFEVRQPGNPTPWRADLTVVREIRGGSAASAKAIRNAMFAKGMTPATVVRDLRLGDPAARALYKFEVEIEFLPDGAAASDIKAVVPKNVTAAVEAVLAVTHPGYHEEAARQAEIHFAARQLFHRPQDSAEARFFRYDRGLRRLAAPVKTLTRHEYKGIWPPVGYVVLDKTDGDRALAVAHDGHLAIVTADRVRIHTPAHMTSPGKTPPAWLARPSVVDGEYHEASDTFFAFDVIALLGEHVSDEGYEKRAARLAEAVAALRNYAPKIETKPFALITASEPAALEAQFRTILDAKRPYETDGLILVEPGKPYTETVTWKWKSLEDTTIDFLARRVPTALRAGWPEGPAGHEPYALFSGINPRLFRALGLERLEGYERFFPDGGAPTYFPIQFATPDAPRAYLYYHPEGAKSVEGQIVEMRCLGGDGGPCAAAGAGTAEAPTWSLVRVRTERSRDAQRGADFGNDYSSAAHNWTNYIDPFGVELLWKGPAGGYFAAKKTEAYRAQTAFTSFVKTRRITGLLGHATFVVDGGIGNGQDLGRYLEAEVRFLVGIDVDRGAIAELERRILSHTRASAHKKRNQKRTRTRLFAFQGDLAKPWEETVARLRGISGRLPAQADAFVMNLAVHYLAGSPATIANLANLCRAIVRPGGHVIFTTMLGDRVHKLLEGAGVAAGGCWDSRVDGVRRYSLKRLYADAELTPAGQQVGVLLPFSNGEYYTEFLVNPVTFRDVFRDRGFELHEVTPFSKYLPDFRVRNAAMFRRMTQADKEYVGLYGELVFRRLEK